MPGTRAPHLPAWPHLQTTSKILMGTHQVFHTAHFPGQGFYVWGKFLVSEVGIFGLFSIAAVPFSQLNGSMVQLR